MPPRGELRRRWRASSAPGRCSRPIRILHVNHGTQLLALGRANEALDSFERALSLQPKDAVTHYNRGLALLRAQASRRGAGEL